MLSTRFSGAFKRMPLGSKLPEGAVLCGLPILVALVAPIQLYPPPGWVDPALYLGWFLNFPALIERFGPDYQAMRLPWVVSGFAAHRIFQPAIAHLVLVYGFHLLATVSLYTMVASRYGRLAGLAATLFLTLNPLWIAAITRGYVDGPGIAFQLACIASVANLERWRHGWAPGLLAGAFGGLTLHTHPIIGSFTVVAVLLWLWTQRVGWRLFMIVAAASGAGGVAVTVLLGLFSYEFGGPFLFFLVQFGQTLRSFEGSGLLYARSIPQWLPEAYMLFAPVALTLIGLFTLATLAGSCRPHLLRASCAFLGLWLAWSIIWDFGVGGSTLQWSFYVTFSVGPQATVMAALVGLALEEHADLSRRVRVVLCIGLFTAGIGPLIAAPALWSMEQGLRTTGAVWIALAIVTGLVAYAFRTRAAPLASLLLLFEVSVAGVLNADTRRLFRVDGNPDYRAFYRAAGHVNDFIKNNIEPGRALALWYNFDEPVTGDPRVDEWLNHRLHFRSSSLKQTMLDSLASLWLWHRVNLNREMPLLGHVLGNDYLQPIFTQGNVVLLCLVPERCEEGFDALKEVGSTAMLMARTKILEPAFVDMTVMIVNLDKLGASVSGPVAAPSIDVEEFGPREAVVGIPFNRQPNGGSAIWLRAPGLSPDAIVQLDGRPLASAVVGDVISAIIPARLLQEAGERKVRILDRNPRRVSEPVILTLKPR